MKLIRAWHAFLDDCGQLAEHGGRLLTIGIDPEHRLWMLGDAIGGQERPISEDTAGWLSATLAGAARAAAATGEPDSYEAACDRFNRAAAAYHRAKAEAERIMRDADDERETASAHLARFEKSPGIPLPECDPLQRDDAEPAAPDTHKESAWCEKCGSAVGPVAPVVFVVTDFAPAPGATADDIDGLLDPETIYLCKTCAGDGEPDTA